MRLREVKQPILGHTEAKWWSTNPNPALTSTPGASYWHPPAVGNDCQHEPQMLTLESSILMLEWKGNPLNSKT